MRNTSGTAVWAPSLIGEAVPKMMKLDGNENVSSALPKSMFHRHAVITDNCTVDKDGTW